MADEPESNGSQMPLQGVVMCCTSIPPEKRSELASIASEMGAIHKLDLTSDVTHLLVGDPDTPKYKYVAKLRPDVKCLSPEWVDAVRQSWIEGDETDVKALEAQYKLPVFVGLRVCVTGFDDLDFRQQLMNSINGNGGCYCGDLTKDVTHLVAKTAEGKKYEYAGNWGIKTVSTEWLLDSLERGMILDESLYHPLTPPEERGKNAWIRRTVSVTSLGKRLRDDGPVPSISRKLRRVASAKLSSQNEGIWTDIVGGGFGPQERTHREWDRHRQNADTPVDCSSQTMTGDPNSVHPAPLELDDNKRLLENVLSMSNGPDNSGTKRGLFQGKRFYIHGFDQRQTSILQKHLSSHDAEITSSLLELSQLGIPDQPSEAYLIVPYTTPQRDLPSTPSSYTQPITVTDMWVERCLHRKSFVQPEENVTSMPLSQFPIPEFGKMSICSTGFSGVDLLQVGKIVTHLGASYQEYFTRKSSILICNSTTPSEKLRHALEWGVPSVSADWLWDCVKDGVKKPIKPYLIRAPTASTEVGRLRTSARQPARETEGAHDIDLKSHAVHIDQVPIQPRNRERIEVPESFSNNKCGSEPRGLLPDPPPMKCQTSFIKTERDQSLQPAPSSEEPHRGTPTDVAPLQEVSANSPTKASTTSSQLKPSPSLQSNPPKPETDPKYQDSLATSIAALLSHTRQLNNSMTSHLDNHSRPQHAPTAPPPGRRRRALLGRAPSNVSARSNSISISRASSVDTLNTDGLGTPIEPTATSSLVLDSVGIKSLRDEEQEDMESTPRGTQLGYHDPEVGEWREKMVRKMAGKGDIKDVGASKARGMAADIGTVKDVDRGNSWNGRGSGRATRQRGLRRAGF